MRTDSIRCPSWSSWTAFAVSPASAPMTWLASIVLKRKSTSSAFRRPTGRSVSPSKSSTSDRCAPASTWPARYAGSPRASSHAASTEWSVSLIAGRRPASGASVTAAEDQEDVVEERQDGDERAGDIGPGRGLEDGPRAILLLTHHPEAADEGKRLARRPDLDRQRGEREHHGAGEEDEADDRETLELKQQARDDEPRSDSRPQLGGGHDRLA